MRKLVNKHKIDKEVFLEPFLLRSIRGFEEGLLNVNTSFEKYQQELITKALQSLPIKDMDVLEVGTQSGIYLKSIAPKKPRELYGAALFPPLMQQAETLLGETKANLGLFNGKMLTYPHNSFDLVFTAGFLQNYADSKAMKKILYDIGNISRAFVVIIEELRTNYLKTDYYRGREPDYFINHFESMNYKLLGRSHYPTKATELFRDYLMQQYNATNQQILGCPLSKQALAVAKQWLPYVKKLDGMLGGKDGITKLIFKKESSEEVYY